jgi:hypothetical protein
MFKPSPASCSHHFLNLLFLLAAGIWQCTIFWQFYFPPYVLCDLTKKVWVTTNFAKSSFLQIYLISWLDLVLHPSSSQTAPYILHTNFSLKARRAFSSAEFNIDVCASYVTTGLTRALYNFILVSQDKVDDLRRFILAKYASLLAINLLFISSCTFTFLFNSIPR